MSHRTARVCGICPVAYQTSACQADPDDGRWSSAQGLDRLAGACPTVKIARLV
jgi:hypothetical protein